MGDIIEQLEDEARDEYQRRYATGAGSIGICGTPELMLNAADEIKALRSRLGSVARDVDAIEIAAKLAMREIGVDPLGAKVHLLKIVERCDELAERLGDKLGVVENRKGVLDELAAESQKLGLYQQFPHPPTGDHAGCDMCDGSGWKEIMIGPNVQRMPCLERVVDRTGTNRYVSDSSENEMKPLPTPWGSEEAKAETDVSYELRRKVKVPGQRHYCSAKGCWNLATSGERCGYHVDQSQPNPQK
jgi:hypothetical protein